MVELKTKPSDISIENYLLHLEDTRKQEAQTLINLFESLTQEKAVIWGDSIIGFGSRMYHYTSGRNIHYFLIGFAIRKKAITLYLMNDTNTKDLSSLGKHTKGVGCLYINSLKDIDLKTLKSIAKESIQEALNRP
jgi:hypothetical protein